MTKKSAASELYDALAGDDTEDGSSGAKKTLINLDSVTLEEGTPLLFVLDTMPVEIVRVDRVTGEETRSWACKAHNPRTGDKFRLWCPTMLASMLNEEGDDCIGSTFEAIRHPKEKGKRYARVELYRVG